ncbi:PAS/PAC sensor signal transduction histidine kinase [Methanohalobium evestigatum Z-7303]|uniref:histidine kinase n=1 Tax=Methanohalobium evestigatum (strain ATCC BAA-1072 / DSM 3721 / NBRC 107634 / OCM 161 / Z-7303) TaxID=644295 RepID=D7E927_METEZ|nr:ATP-binding protein [Methanohalobium evestigatum]ADI73975.1 PAS/PAC sensor signal transduction histidine kinase [Methanohalobium evestigatum Z-7303]
MKESEERFRTVIELAADAIIAHDFDGDIVYVNELAYENLGYTKSELLSMNIMDIEPYNENYNSRKRYRNKLSIHNSYRIETSHERKYGSIYPVEVKITRIDLDSEPVILGFCRDITTRKQAEENLIIAKLEAEATSQAKSELLANVSHELRTPLTSIIGFSDIMLKGKAGKLNNNQINYLNKIHKSGQNLLDLINDLLDLSKIESGKMELHYEKISLTEIIEDLMAKLSPLASEKGLTLDSKINPDIEYVCMDNIKLRQILYNLIYNAIKFTNNGSITTEVDFVDNNYQFSVIDTGIGIPEDKQDEIFESFKQLDSSTKRRHAGTGLGLTLVKRLVEIHGGYIEVESKYGEGSRFTFTIPMQIKIATESK